MAAVCGAAAPETPPGSSLASPSASPANILETIEGNRADVRRLMDAALQLDPLSPFVQALGSTAFYIMGDFADAEPLSARGIALQPDYLLANWAHGLALCGLERFDEGIAHLEKATALSRAPIFLCMLGLGLGLAGRREEARRLLTELDDRGSRGEYIPAFSRLGIQVGLGDPDGVRRELTACVSEVTPPFSFRVTSGIFLDRYRTDPEVARLLDAWYRGDPPAAG